MKGKGGISVWLRVGAVMMALGVMAGAFGAHALRANITPEDLAIFHTGVLYHLLHALSLVVIGSLLSVRPALDEEGGRAAHAGLARGAAFLLFGLCVFSGSLYALVLSGERWLGVITPIGGLSMIIGWLVLALATGAARSASAA